jgi:exodeoxyribonuclease V gamma subunit
MLILHSAATSENLLADMLNTLKNKPSSVFAQEFFLVANQGQERWLSQQLAQQFGVFAHYQFLLPEQFFRQLACKIGSDLHNPEFDRDLMQWRIEGLLRDIEEDVFLPLKHYLDGDNNAMKRYQLAAQLARLFENYQLFRPDLLANWQQSTAEDWQQALWQKITAQIGRPHQGELWQQAIHQLNASPKGKFKYQLPNRLFVFGINQLPPLWLAFLNAVAKHCEVHFYWLNALPEFNTHPVHPLLASLGKQSSEFQQALAAFPHDCQFTEGLAVIETKTILQQLQHDIGHNSDSVLRRREASKHSAESSNDTSITIHACHSRMREVEVLKNQLLQSLEHNPTLQLREIAVTAPNIQDYAAFISAVFADIPHHIVGRRDAKFCVSTLDSFIRFLKVCNSRFGWQAVLDLLEQPAVYPNFDLAETDLELLKYWLSDTNVRWGKSAAHKAQLGLPPLLENTWQQSLERLLMGYAVNIDEYFVDGILPYKNIEGSSAQALGGLCAFMDLLFNASAELTQVQALQAWSEKLSHYADLLFAQITASERQELNELLADFAEKFTAVHQHPLDLAVIIHWLEQAVAEQKSASGLLRGSVTFCSINAVRGIPFQVIAVLGMNDGDFPRTDKHPTFDLLAQNPRLGDPSQRADDRQQFLELLLSARQQLIITYIGQSLAQNQSIPPSVVISELLEVLEFDYQLKDVVIKQPLQPFSPRYFNQEDEKLFSYSKADYETALALNNVKPDVKIWWQGAIETEKNQLIELADMFAFYRHPQRYFLRRQLDLHLQSLEAEPEEREPFALDGLESYAINHDWINALLNGENFDVAKLQAQGRWLSGVMGELQFNHQQSQLIEFVETINNLNLGEKQEDIAIDRDFSGFRLIGKLSNRYENGSLFYRFANLKGKDLLIALLHHCLMNEELGAHDTYLLSLDELLVLTPDLYQPDLLQSLIALYLKGQQQPDALFTDSLLDYVKQAYTLKNSTRATKPALAVAQEKLKLSLEQNYEPELQRLYSLATNENLSGLLNEEFISFCENFMLPIWEGTHSKS